MEVDWVRFTPFDEIYECPSESYPDFGWSPSTSFTEPPTSEKCTYVTSSPIPAPSVADDDNGIGDDTVDNDDGPVWSYIEHGCTDLPSTFCGNQSTGSYCKDYQSDGCGRSICQFDSFATLNACPTGAPISSPTEGGTSAPVASPPVTSVPTGSPVSSPTNNPITSAPTGSPVSSPTNNPVTSAPTKAPVSSPTNNPITSAPTEAPVSNPTNNPTPVPSVDNGDGLLLEYYENGCTDLPSTFCGNQSAGSYCKDYQSDSCGRSICQSDSFATLNGCPPAGSDDEDVYLSQGCAALEDPQAFCDSLFGSYCKDYQSDSCGRSICKGDDFSSLKEECAITEIDSAKFFIRTKTRNGIKTPVKKSCRWLKLQTGGKIERLCNKTETKFGFGPAKDVCPITCA